MKTKKIVTLVLSLSIMMVLLNSCTTKAEVKTETITKSESESWQSVLDNQLQELGHRNWIVIADSAYPAQNSDGITTIVTGEDQTSVLAYVLGQIENAKHVKPIIMVDKELEYITDQEAPGIDAYKVELKKLISGKEVSNMPHIDIIEKLDEGSKLFKVVILKTNMTIPYTSVFINLDCDYWSAEKEAALRAKIANSTTSLE